MPLPISKVKEIQQQNKEGIIPADLGELVEVENQPAKALDYENVVGQDSLTRLDERRNNNKKKNNNNNRNRNNKDRKPGAPAPENRAGNPSNQPRQQGAAPSADKPAQQQNPDAPKAPQGNRPPQQQANRPPQAQGDKPAMGDKPAQENRNRNNRRRPNRPNKNNSNPPPDSNA